MRHPFHHRIRLVTYPVAIIVIAIVVVSIVVLVRMNWRGDPRSENADPFLNLMMKGVRIYDNPNGEVIGVEIGLSYASDQDFRVLSNCSKLERLNLVGRNIDGSVLQYVEGCTSLWFLSLGGGTDIVSEEYLKPLETLTSLSDLTLAYRSVSDTSLKYIANLKKLRVLHLSGTSITDEGMQHLGNLENLARLYLNETSISDKGIASLSRLSKLSTLELRKTRITDAAIGHICELVGLEHLELTATDITPTGLAGLAKLRNLNFLAVRDTCITVDDLKPIVSGRAEMTVIFDDDVLYYKNGVLVSD